MAWSDKTLKQFQDALASDAPTPGGGSAAGVALGQAAALATMVSDLTLSKERYNDGWNVANKIKAITEDMLSEALELATRDSDAFDAVVASFRMSKSTDEEKESRIKAIHLATLGAAEVPFQTAILALELLKLLPELAEKGNPNALSDVGVSALLASTALKGGIFNVEINLQSLPSDQGMEMRKRLPQLIEDGRIYSKRCMDAVRTRLSDS